MVEHAHDNRTMNLSGRWMEEKSEGISRTEAEMGWWRGAATAALRYASKAGLKSGGGVRRSRNGAGLAMRGLLFVWYNIALCQTITAMRCRKQPCACASPFAVRRSPSACLALACAVLAVQLAALPPCRLALCFSFSRSCFMRCRKARRRIIVTIHIQEEKIYSVYHILPLHFIISMCACMRVCACAL